MDSNRRDKEPVSLYHRALEWVLYSTAALALSSSVRRVSRRLMQGNRHKLLIQQWRFIIAVKPER